MVLLKIATIFNIDLEFEIAEAYKRILAYLADFTILVLFFISMKNFYYGGITVDTSYLESHRGLDILTISLPMLLYSLVTEVWMHGQTVGKKIFNLRVISLDGGEPSISQYVVRWMFKVFEWPFFFGYIMFSGQALIGYITTTLSIGGIAVIILAISKKNQRLGDLAANTAVVNVRSPYTVDDTIFMDIKEEHYTVSFPQVLKLSDRDITTIKNVITLIEKEHNYAVGERVAKKVKTVLNIEHDFEPHVFLKKLLKDYNYLAGK